MKRRKIFIILLVIAIITLFALIMLCIKHRFIEDGNTDDTHMNTIEGKVLVIEDEKTIILDISDESSGYKQGDKVRVKFSRYEEHCIMSSTGGKKQHLKWEMK